jgi:CubicO group peptidase (beta-lactamase class C family)
MYSPDRESNIEEHYSRLLKKVPEDCAVGRYEYSNLNYQLLGLIIENITSMSYAAFMEESVLIPFDMHSTFATHSETKSYGLIPSWQYLLYYPLLQKNILYSNYEVSSGFISSTTEDMCRFLSALMKLSDTSENNIIERDIAAQMFKPGGAKVTKYGMGCEIRKRNTMERYKHDGLTQSFASSMLILPELEIGLIVMANVNNSPATIEMADGIMRILTGKESLSYTRTGFYLRNSLPLFALWVIIILIIRIYHWINRKFPIGIIKKLWPNIWLLAGIIFGLFWIIYFPIAFNTPLLAIIDYEPNSGYSLIVLSVGLIVNSCIGYFLKLRNYKAAEL